MPSRRAVLMIRHAISPRFAIRMRLNKAACPARPSRRLAAHKRKSQHRVIDNELYIRVRERRSRTWLAIQASTNASTSGDLRMRAHSEGESKCVRKCATMGERAMAAKSSCSLPDITSRNDIDLLLSPAGTLWNHPD